MTRLLIPALMLGFTATALNAETITLNTTTLPSTQGWTYVAGGDGAARSEASVYAIVGGELHQDSLGIGMTQGGGNYFNRTVTLTSTQNWSLTMVARLSAFESVLAPAYPFGLFIGGGGGLAIGIGSDNFQYISGNGSVLQIARPVGFDASAYNSYRLSTSGGNLQSFSVNGVPIFTAQGFLGGNPAFISFGDGTGFANARADIRSLQYVSASVPEPASWSLLITGFALTGTALRRRRPQSVTA
nr:PEPxxWA-CTERM sorting domain-containing protein [Polymorphobacter sp.]